MMSPAKMQRIREMVNDYADGDTGARLELMLQAYDFIKSLLDHVEALEAERALEREVLALAARGLWPFAAAYDGGALDKMRAFDEVLVQAQVAALRLAAQAYGAITNQRPLALAAM